MNSHARLGSVLTRIAAAVGVGNVRRDEAARLEANGAATAELLSRVESVLPRLEAAADRLEQAADQSV